MNALPSIPQKATVAAHPLGTHRRSLRRVSACAATATLLAAAWALWPLGSVADPLPPAPEFAVAAATSPRPEALNLAAFSTPTWDAPPLPPPPPQPPKTASAAPPPPPPPPLKLQLLGIVRDDTLDAAGAPVYIAAIYDEAADRLLMLRAGDRLGAAGFAPAGAPGVITRVTADAVELRDASGPRRLALRQPIAPIPGLSPGSPPTRREGP